MFLTTHRWLTVLLSCILSFTLTSTGHAMQQQPVAPVQEFVPIDRQIDANKMQPAVRAAYLEAARLWKVPIKNIGWGELARLSSIIAKIPPRELVTAAGALSDQDVYGHTRAIETSLLLMARVAQKTSGGDPLAPMSISALCRGMRGHFERLLPNENPNVPWSQEQRAMYVALRPAYSSLASLFEAMGNEGVSVAREVNRTGLTGSAIKQFIQQIVDKAKRETPAGGNAKDTILAILKNQKAVKEILDNIKLSDGQALGAVLDEKFGLTSAQFAGALSHGLSAGQGIFILIDQWEKLSDSQKVFGICQVAAHGILAAQAAMAVGTMGVKAGLLMMFLMVCDFLDLGIDLGFPGDGATDGEDGNDDGDPAPQGTDPQGKGPTGDPAADLTPSPLAPGLPENPEVLPGGGEGDPVETQVGLGLLEKEATEKLKGASPEAGALKAAVEATNKSIDLALKGAAEGANQNVGTIAVNQPLTEAEARSMSAMRAQQSKEIRSIK